MSNKIIFAKDLVKWYGKEVLALNKVSFEVDDGDFFVIIGPSGCGKSTLMKIMAGILDYDHGELHIKGENMKDVPAYKRDVSLMLETYAVFPHMNVFDNVAFGLRMLGKDKSEIEHDVKEAIDLVGLSGLEKRSPLELSGGQRQRVALARSLVIKPSVLLLDEPLSHVDYILQRKLMEDFKTLHKKLGQTFILTTHVQEHALTLADTMMVMNTGVIEQMGRPDEIYCRPKTVFAARFVGDISLFPGEVTSKEGREYFVKTEFGELKALAPDGTDLVGKKLAYGIRPEFVKVGDEAGSCENKYKARFVGHYYFGNLVECMFEIKDGVTMRATVSPQTAINLRLAETYTVGWHPEDAILLEKPSVIEGLNIEEVIYGK
ncbi:MAG: ABC transporter ATP-binding protein [Candidatus Bathyarchaeia archaeon]